MNKFKGEFSKEPGKKPKGWSSKAARAAFHDILDDKSMRVSADSCRDGRIQKIPVILTEEILETEVY